MGADAVPECQWVLVESVKGCPWCAAEEAYKLSIGHSCGESTEKYTSFCDLIRKAREQDSEFHRLSHEPNRCEGCGAVLDDRRGLDRHGHRLCESGLCDQWFCPDCNETTSSAGPIDCPTCGSAASGEQP